MSKLRGLRAGTSERADDGTYGHMGLAAADGEIDRLVYDLYGLTEKEIKIVEEATR